jgi:hypothetical protein
MITHEPRRQRYVITVGDVRRVSTYESGAGSDCSRAQAWQFARELEAELKRKARAAVRAEIDEAAATDAAAEVAEAARWAA